VTEARSRFGGSACVAGRRTQPDRPVPAASPRCGAAEPDDAPLCLGVSVAWFRGRDRSV